MIVGEDDPDRLASHGDLLFIAPAGSAVEDTRLAGYFMSRKLFVFAPGSSVPKIECDGLFFEAWLNGRCDGIRMEPSLILHHISQMK